MPKEKFNPIAEFPILPGAEIASDEKQSNIIDATYPPIEPLKNKSKLPNLEMYIKEKKPEKMVIENINKNKLFVIRAVIVTILVVLILVGIFLTLNFIPRIASNVSDYSKSLATIFVSTNKATTTASTTPTKKVATTSKAKTVVTTPTKIIQQKTPAKLVVNILSTEAIGNRVIVRFNVQNIGGTTSGKWSFSAKLPSTFTPNYYSVVQNSITPQSGIIYTLGFDADQDLPVLITLYTK